MPELIVRKWDGPYSFMIFREYGVYKARRGDTGEIQFKDPSASVVIQNAVNSLLQGGTIFLKEVQLPADVTFGSNILIVEDYQGERKFYSNNKEYRSTEETASYIIFIEDGVVKAKNGHNGEIDFSGSDAATVIQSAINALTRGGKIFIKAGAYYCYSEIDLAKDVALIGENPDGRYSSFATRLIAKGTARGVMVRFYRDALTDVNLAIEGITFDDPDNLASGAILYFRYGRGIRLNNVATRNGGKYGIFFSNCEIVHLSRVHVIAPVEHGIVMGDWNGEVTIRECEVSSVGLSGILLDNRANVIDLIENDIYLCGNHGIYVRNYSGETISSVNIFRNNIHHNTYYGLAFTINGTIEGCLAYYNQFNDNDWGAVSPSPSGVKMFSNKGYTTENSGVATIPNGSSSVVVNHGLAAAPSVVKLTGTHSEVANCWVTNVTSTQFTINAPAAVTADRDVYWQAEV